MGLNEKVREIRDRALERGEQPVAKSLQGVTKERIAEVLRALDLETPDRIDAVFALLDDTLVSWFTTAKEGTKFSDGATVAHIASHVGILQRGNVKLDREGRDYWIKPLREIGAVESIILDKKTRAFLLGHPIAKSPNSAHRLANEFKRLLQADETHWKRYLDDWIREEKIRDRRAFQAARAEETRRRVETAHLDLIKACCEQYAPRFLPGFEVIYVDDSDGDRITDEDRDCLRDAGLELSLGDPMPDVLLWNRETDELWVMEAVTSDGEVDEHKVRRMTAFAASHGKDAIGFTTAYPTWKIAAQRQGKHKNLAAATYVWILEDGSKHYRAESFRA